jgi:hypothetical protein
MIQVGQAHRLPHLRRALKHIVDNGEGTWFTTPGAIAAHMDFTFGGARTRLTA